MREQLSVKPCVPVIKGSRSSEKGKASWRRRRPWAELSQVGNIGFSKVEESIPGFRSLWKVVGRVGRVPNCGGSEKTGLTAAGKPGLVAVASPWRVVKGRQRSLDLTAP